VDLTALVLEDFGIPLIGVQPTGLGADPCATLWRGLTADGSSYAVKSSSTRQAGLLVADFLARQGVGGVPAPVRTVSSGLTTPHDGGVVSVVPWVAGSRAIDTGLDLQQWKAFGAVLGAVHATAPPAPLAGRAALLPLDRHDPAVQVERARAFPGRLRRARAAASTDPVTAELAGLWAGSGDAVMAVADHAESSSRSASWDCGDVVIGHADPHHGNLLLDDRGGTWLVDWDDAVLAPREADLIFVVGGVYSHAPITSTDERAFFEGYTPASGGVTRSDLDAGRMTYYRSVRALTDFLDFADDALDRRHNESDRTAALRIASGALSPGGIVALTLSEAAAGR
jgi:spectinomycin phosphotransferase